MKKMMTAVLILTFLVTLHGRNADMDSERADIEKVIEKGYLIAMFKEINVDLLKKYWHPECDLVAFRDNCVVKTNLWQRLEAAQKSGRLPKSVPSARHEISHMDISGNAAVVTVQIYFGDIHIYTDYFSLYKFADGWKVVSKIWYQHNRQK